jgi:hypothetical protein
LALSGWPQLIVNEYGLPAPVDWVYRLYGGGVIAGLRGEPVPAYFGVREGRHLTWIPFALTQAPG